MKIKQTQTNLIKKGLDKMKKIINAEVYIDTDSDLFKTKINTFSNNKSLVISALALIVNNTLEEFNISNKTFFNFLNSVDIYCETFKEDLICKK